MKVRVCFSGEVHVVDTSTLHDNNDHQIKSQCFYNVPIGQDHINMARSIVLKLLTSPFNSPEGIVLSADMPYQKKAIINIVRPAVLRTYYGVTIQDVSRTQL